MSAIKTTVEIRVGEGKGEEELGMQMKTVQAFVRNRSMPVKVNCGWRKRNSLGRTAFR